MITHREQMLHCMRALPHSKLQLPIRLSPCWLWQLSVPNGCMPCCLLRLSVSIICWPCYLTFSHMLRRKLHYTDSSESSLKSATPRLQHKNGVSVMPAATGSRQMQPQARGVFVNHIIILTMMIPHPWACCNAVLKAAIHSFCLFLGESPDQLGGQCEHQRLTAP